MSELAEARVRQWRRRGGMWGATLGCGAVLIVLPWWFHYRDASFSDYLKANSRRFTGPVQKQLIGVGTTRADVDRVMGKPDQEYMTVCWYTKPGTAHPCPYPIPFTRLSYEGCRFDVILDPKTATVIAIEDIP